ncbi:MAG: aminotransferase class III-fold pyridoxal phosphate-dependent enzyme [Gemmatimonadales bacterium]|nr:aminotransferase class III-fold pyridoxal phosphate-dependent enzyme [Gemmatimonadales bacterium]
MSSDAYADSLLRRRTEVLGPAYRHFYEEPLTPVRAEDVWLYDAQGRAHLDCYNNVPCVGHCHPRVVQALSEQAGRLNTHTRYLHEGVVAYAERLASLFPQPLSKVALTCSGSEANDLALRIAQAATGRTGLIVTDFAYHGVTLALADISPSLRRSDAPHVRLVRAPKPFGRASAADVAARFVEDIQAAARDLQARGFGLSAMMVDTVFASDGIFADRNGALSAAAQAVREAGGVFIADEVQGGFGRTGDFWWAFQREAGLVPDIVTMGKPMGAGHPMAGLVMQPRLAESFGRQQRYFNTFGGNTVSTAVGHAVLDVIEQEGLRERAVDVGGYLRQGLHRLAHEHPGIGDVRGLGLYIGVELVDTTQHGTPDPQLAAFVVNALRRAGVLISVCGREANVLKIRPPLSFRREHADIFLEAMADALAGTPATAPT